MTNESKTNRTIGSWIEKNKGVQVKLFASLRGWQKEWMRYYDSDFMAKLVNWKVGPVYENWEKIEQKPIES